MITKNISEAKSQLSALLEEVQKGRDVLIAKSGKPIARLSRYQRTEEPRMPGALRGKIIIGSGFDELPPDVERAFGGTDS